MKFGLSDMDFEKINLVFTKFPTIRKVLIYGSRAKGNFREGSDIDLALFGNHLENETIFQLVNEMDELNLPYLFDFCIYDQLDSTNFKEHIDRIGQVFYSNNERPA